MPTNTYTPIGSVTLATATSEVTFTVPTGYRDLILVAEGTHSSDSGDRFVRVNGQTTNYSTVIMAGDGSTTSSNSYTTLGGMIPLAAGTNRGNTIIQFLDASATDKHKTILIRSGQAGSVVRASANRWASTDAISSITLYGSTGTFNIGFTFNLFGIVA